jgi:flavin reductase (DIM6/NTAB) family NADH-FMN oxidoreductase RutF
MKSAATAADATIANEFRGVMAGVCAPVSIISSISDGRPHGTTVSAFSSLSMSPAMMMVALSVESDLLAIVRNTATFAVNVLNSGQADLAAAFARKGRDKFADVEWTLEEGLPRIAGVRGWVGCSLHDLVPGGDHMILIGTVKAAYAGSGPPLTYLERAFGSHTPLVGG